MNKIIAFANQKGGVGKTTLCILFADYLAWKKKGVVLLDADDQRSVTTKREKDVEFFGEEPPYEVQHVGIQDVDYMQRLMANARQIDGTVIIDCPGNVRDDGLLPVFTQADAIIIPFEYEDICLEATTDFVNLLNTIKQKVGGSAKYIFVPNKLQSSFGTAAEVSMWKQCASMYGMVGKVMPKVPQRANLKRIDTYDITPSQREILRATFEGIIKELSI